MRRAVPAALAALTLSACAYVQVGFGRRVSDRELALQDEIRAYYEDVGAAFASGNAQALTQLFAPGITRPMTRDRIRAWAEDFFAKHGPARFTVVSLDFERLGPVSAVVRLDYRVETRGGDGSFAGVERDELVRRDGRWSVTAWEKETDEPRRHKDTKNGGKGNGKRLRPVVNP
ncbi:MAG: hypothetical protein KGM24_09965 [Elusimicrobia bacterium]|nr:hypothetical protein [Elusimicrobiota bacterium]